jgi:O-antigen/teichoic acid export membrane protein
VDELEESRFTLTQLASLSLAMSFFFAFNQATTFIARILFRVSLEPSQYGVFAFLINIFVFFSGINGFSLNVPIIARISDNPSDNEFYSFFSSQVLSASLIFGLVLSFTFLLWTLPVTNELLLVVYLAVMVLLYSTGLIQHCFPRGRQRFRPAAVSLLIVGLGRLVLLIPFFLAISTNLSFAMLVYTLPLLGWWVSYFYHEGVPSISRPKPKFILSVYVDSFISYLYPLGEQLPVILGVVLLTVFHGFEAAGDLDFALIPFFAMGVLFAGISFVTISKARALPSFRQIVRRMFPSVIIPLTVLSGLFVIAAYCFETWAMTVFTFVGLPTSVYWPVVFLIAVGVPVSILISVMLSYFQGQGAIKPVGAIVAVCALGSIPLQIAFAYYLSISGVMLSIVGIKIATLLLMLGYGYRTTRASEILAGGGHVGE